MSLWKTRTGKHQEAFDLLKTWLTIAPVLGYQDFSWPFELDTDASLPGLGAVLLQRDENGTSHVIAYACRSLQPSDAKLQLSKIRAISTKVGGDGKTKGLPLRVQVHHVYQ